MTTPYRVALLLVAGIGAIYSLVRAESIFHIYARAGYSGTRPPPPFEEFIIFGAIGGILTLIFLVLGFTIVYRCFAWKK